MAYRKSSNDEQGKQNSLKSMLINASRRIHHARRLIPTYKNGSRVIINHHFGAIVTFTLNLQPRPSLAGSDSTKIPAFSFLLK